MTEGDGDPRWLRLVRRPAPWLIVFGGASEHEEGNDCVDLYGRVHTAAGSLRAIARELEQEDTR